MAGWANILLGFAQRLAVVPVILTYWNVDNYGLYLLMTAWIAFLWVPSRSFEGVAVFECMRKGGDTPADLSKLIFSTSATNLAITTGLMLMLVMALQNGVVPDSFLENSSVTDLVMLVAVSLGIRALVGYPIALINAGLYCYGYQPKVAWLTVLQNVFVTLVPPVGVMAGLTPLSVALLEICSVGLLSSLFFLIFSITWAKKVGIWQWQFNWYYGVELWLFSIRNFIKDVFDLFRQQGIRAVLGPSVGNGELTRFTTIRTSANVATQGIGTLTTPIMPELMRFFAQKDLRGIRSAFSAIWLPTVLLLCPALVLAQGFIEPLFMAWTRGKVVFDPLVFALLSVGVLVNALTQPVTAVVQGNNLLNRQLFVSLSAGLVVILLLLLVTPLWGIGGVAFALLMGELTSAINYRRGAIWWMNQHDLKWPKQYSARIDLMVAYTSVALVIMAVLQRLHMPSLAVWSCAGIWAIGMSRLLLALATDFPASLTKLQALGRSKLSFLKYDAR